MIHVIVIIFNSLSKAKFEINLKKKTQSKWLLIFSKSEIRYLHFNRLYQTTKDHVI